MTIQPAVRVLANYAATGVLVFLFVLLVVKVGLLWSNERSEEPQVFTTAPALKHALDQRSRLLVLDIRSRAEFARGHIPTARNIPHDELEVRAPNELNPEDRIVAYCRCRDDTSSDMARQILTSLGFKNVVYLQGGLQRWEEEQYGTETGTK
ncbi:MAG TPA: rhodanese-like domain-containing protein [Pyrinomonadaceae bacterium]|jgi:rhodanese-related sulfurtransferase|nr:rhodanese-like domain-containing protein [Pyrinomonadaceae bacterium]